MEKNSDIIYGLRPVMEAIRSGQQVDRIFIQNALQGVLVGELKSLVKERQVPFQFVPIEKLNRMSRNGNHQGVVATIAPVRYRSFVDVVESLLEAGKVPFIVMLDHVTDVRNMGAIVRTAECAGVDAVVVPEHGSAQISADAVKSSSGALLRLPICREGNFKTVINLAKQYDMQICAATEKGSVAYTKVDFRKPTLLVMGAEEKGISPDVLKMCDVRAAIPILGDIQSLNVSVAAGVLIYEALRQRSNG
ncbi:MAG: 23S rRNA (guanosine(2251)-2'-O)-methyltransferase RlmB [Bacteroidales bacterium]|nr:23S rRNA (guanosine(2251)-2'-O)-methyltransferase RlmB [Candidatus Colimorpha onthohippi]